MCDEVDNNCDSVVDSDAVDRVTYYRDIDGDGYGIEGGHKWLVSSQRVHD